MSMQRVSLMDCSVWGVILYPDGSPYSETFEKELPSRLESLGFPCVCSPIHDKDVWLDGDNVSSDGTVHEVGSPKKRHYHVIFERKSKQYATVLKAFKKAFNYDYNDTTEKPCFNWFEGINNPVRMYEYLTHDTPKCIELGKAHYSKEDLLSFNGGFECIEFYSQIQQDLYDKENIDNDICNRLIAFAELHNVVSYNSLVFHCIKYDKELASAMSKLKYGQIDFLKSYFKSLHFICTPSTFNLTDSFSEGFRPTSPAENDFVSKLGF